MASSTVQHKDKPFTPNRERMLREAKKIMDDPEIMAAIREAEEAIKKI